MLHNWLFGDFELLQVVFHVTAFLFSADLGLVGVVQQIIPQLRMLVPDLFPEAAIGIRVVDDV